MKYTLSSSNFNLYSSRYGNAIATETYTESTYCGNSPLDICSLMGVTGCF